MITIRATAGETEYLTATVAEKNGADLTGATFTVGLSASRETPPESWGAPDDVTIDGSTATVKLLVDSDTTAGTYWMWVKVDDSPEVILLACTNQKVSVV
ncbi:hypothetical protein [Nocardioides sp. YIM 152315]|uniref:hypothetical protein n=1 Tax=Nocardioides sp. YIM 152315 TaxID=3031760 RepID=UPI0023DB720E|nr:hypothetical protein [Nocardioides sp. YIM 152315]MDF1603418.1 hypothetical protein [Nocardioides sp. YIM 152315]